MFNDTIFGVIYMIRHKTDDTKKVYIGSTNNLKMRIKEHKYECKNDKRKHYNLNVYQYIRENGGLEEYEFIILECIVCNFKWDLLNIEDKYILAYGDMCLNTYRSFLTNEEIKERQKIINKEWYQNNREAIAEKRKEKINCECGVTFRKSDKARHERTIKHQDFIKNNVSK